MVPGLAAAGAFLRTGFAAAAFEDAGFVVVLGTANLGMAGAAAVTLPLLDSRGAVRLRAGFFMRASSSFS